MGVIEAEAVANYAVIGELALDGKLTAVAGALAAAMGANAQGRGLVCPAACGGEAAWVYLTNKVGNNKSGTAETFVN